MVIFSEDFQ